MTKRLIAIFLLIFLNQHSFAETIKYYDYGLSGIKFYVHNEVDNFISEMPHPWQKVKQICARDEPENWSRFIENYNYFNPIEGQIDAIGKVGWMVAISKNFEYSDDVQYVFVLWISAININERVFSIRLSLSELNSFSNINKIKDTNAFPQSIRYKYKSINVEQNNRIFPPLESLPRPISKIVIIIICILTIAVSVLIKKIKY